MKRFEYRTKFWYLTAKGTESKRSLQVLQNVDSYVSRFVEEHEERFYGLWYRRMVHLFSKSNTIILSLKSCWHNVWDTEYMIFTLCNGCIVNVEHTREMPPTIKDWRF